MLFFPPPYTGRTQTQEKIYVHTYCCVCIGVFVCVYVCVFMHIHTCVRACVYVYPVLCHVKFSSPCVSFVAAFLSLERGLFGTRPYASG